jgi:hypothetical protein
MLQETMGNVWKEAGMECVLPPPLSEAEIESFVMGEASFEVIEHARRCAGCAWRITQRRGIESGLGFQLLCDGCPPTMTLGEWRLGLLDETEARVVADHVGRCGWCQRDTEMVIMVGVGTSA